jgi:hypothetical protein
LRGSGDHHRSHPKLDGGAARKGVLRKGASFHISDDARQLVTAGDPTVIGDP